MKTSDGNKENEQKRKKWQCEDFHGTDLALARSGPREGREGTKRPAVQRWGRRRTRRVDGLSLRMDFDRGQGAEGRNTTSSSSVLRG